MEIEAVLEYKRKPSKIERRGAVKGKAGMGALLTYTEKTNNGSS